MCIAVTEQPGRWEEAALGLRQSERRGRPDCEGQMSQKFRGGSPETGNM
jgi:hypothetical protein